MATVRTARSGCCHAFTLL